MNAKAQVALANKLVEFDRQELTADELAATIIATIRAVVAESLPAQPKAVAGEPSGEAPEPLPLGSIRTFRKALGINMGEVADYAGWPVSRVSDIERGIGAQPTFTEIHTYLNALGDIHSQPAQPQEQPAASGPGETEKMPEHTCTLASGAFGLTATRPPCPGCQWLFARGEHWMQQSKAFEAVLPTPPAQAEKPSGGAPSDEDLVGIYSAEFQDTERSAFDARRAGLRALFEAGAASRDAEVRTYQDFVGWCRYRLGSMHAFDGMADRLTELRRELAALEAKGGGKA